MGAIIFGAKPLGGIKTAASELGGPAAANGPNERKHRTSPRRRRPGEREARARGEAGGRRWRRLRAGHRAPAAPAAPADIFNYVCHVTCQQPYMPGEVRSLLLSFRDVCLTRYYL